MQGVESSYFLKSVHAAHAASRHCRSRIPVRQIAANAGMEGSVIIDTIKRSEKVGYGFDFYKETYGDMGAIPPPATMPSSTAALVEASASSMRSFFSFISISVVASISTKRLTAI